MPKKDRFGGLSEEEICKKRVPDIIKHDLDILMVGINPGLTSAFLGHHYGLTGNDFWPCMNQSGLLPRTMTCQNDTELLDVGIGFTNLCARPSRNAADLSRSELKEGAQILLEKIQKYRPKIVAFTGKGIYEAFIGKKKVTLGRQDELIDGTQAIAFVMPSSSPRNCQFPRVQDKVPFFQALHDLRSSMSAKTSSSAVKRKSETTSCSSEGISPQKKVRTS